MRIWGTTEVESGRWQVEGDMRQEEEALVKLVDVETVTAKGDFFCDPLMGKISSHSCIRPVDYNKCGLFL